MSEAHGKKPLPDHDPRRRCRSCRHRCRPPSSSRPATACMLVAVQRALPSSNPTRTAGDVARLVTRWHTMLRLKLGGARVGVRPAFRSGARAPDSGHAEPQGPGATRRRSTVHRSTDRRYNLSDFEEFLDDAAIPDPEAEEKAAREWAERFADKPLVIDPNARIPQEMLDGWMRATDMRFRNTWKRQRHDLKDQSQIRVRSRPGVLRHGRRSVGAADRRSDHPPPQRTTAKSSAPGWTTSRGPSPRPAERTGGAERRRSLRACVSWRAPSSRRRPRPAPLRHRARPVRRRQDRRPTLPPLPRQRRDPGRQRRSCASGSRRCWASGSCAS